MRAWWRQPFHTERNALVCFCNCFGSQHWVLCMNQLCFLESGFFSTPLRWICLPKVWALCRFLVLALQYAFYQSKLLQSFGSAKKVKDSWVVHRSERFPCSSLQSTAFAINLPFKSITVKIRMHKIQRIETESWEPLEKRHLIPN